MNKKIRAVMFGIGEMGKLIMGFMVEKGVEVVGAVDIKRYIGEDIGDVLDLGHQTGVIVNDKLETTLDETKPDIVVMCARTYMRDMYPFFKLALEKGINIITLAEEAYFPWRLYEKEAKELDQLAKIHRVSLTAGGIQDVIWQNLLTTVSGACLKIDKVIGQAVSNVDNYGPAAIASIGVGQTKETFMQRIKNQSMDYSDFGMTMEAAISQLGLHLKSWNEWVEPVIAEKPTVSNGLNTTIAAGRVIGWNQVTETETEEGPVFRAEFISKVCAEDECEGSKFYFKGKPDMTVETPNMPAPYIICASIVNRIPDVLNSEPGFMTLDKLPQPKYKAFSLEQYLIRK